MYKLAGIGLLMAGCIGLGLEKVQDEKKRIGLLYQIKSIILRIQNEMLYGKHTLPEICLLLGTYMEEPFQTIFQNIAQRLLKNNGCVLEKIWKEEVEKGMKGLPLKKEEIEILQVLPKTLGIREEKAQAAHIGQALERVEEQIRALQKEYDNRKKIIMSISISSGLLISILLW